MISGSRLWPAGNAGGILASASECGPARALNGSVICTVVSAPAGLSIDIRPPSASIRSLSPTRPEPAPNSAPPRKSAADSGSPALDQLALASLLASGEYERHVAAARRAYRRRRDLLVHALTARLPGLPVLGAAAGMQLLLSLADLSDDVALAAAAATRGINISPLSPLHLVPSPRRGLLAGFGRLPEHKIPGAVDALSSLLRHHGATGGAATR